MKNMKNMKKKLFGILLALTLCLSLLPTAVFAETADTSWYNVDESSFEISSEAQLLGLASLVNGGNTFAGKTVKLTADITLTGSWTPIGNGSRSGSGYTGKAFKGTFDGDGHTITGLTISSDEADASLGLFGVVDRGIVKDLKLDGVNISATNNKNTGAAIGLMVNGAKAENITVVNGTITGKDGVGGIVGRMAAEGEIKNCENNAAVNSAGKAGGIVGAAYYTAENKEMTISGCTNNGTVTSTNGGGYVGGIAGLSAAKVSGCTNTARVTNTGTSTSASTSIGGIVGEQENYGSVTGCTNSGNVENTNSKAGYGNGGIVGWVRYNGVASDYPRKAVIEVKNNVNSGSVTGGSDAGGIVGMVFHAANVTGNENTATSLSSSNFVAGIVGGFQSITSPDDQKPVQGTSDDSEEIPEGKLNCSNNVSTTTDAQMTTAGTCKSLYVYDNVGASNTGKIENNSTAWVAKIGSAKYATLAAAVEAAETGDTIVLTADVTLTATLTIEPSKTVTLDLNGKIASMANSGTISANDSMLVNKGALTIKDTSAEQSGKLSYKFSGSSGSYYAVTTISNQQGTLNIESGTVENLSESGKYYAFTIDNLTNGKSGDATLNISGGTVTAAWMGAVRGFANSTTNTNTINITGGAITGYVWMQSPNGNTNKGVLKVTGGKITTLNDNTPAIIFDPTDHTGFELTVGGDVDVTGTVYFMYGSQPTVLKVITGGTFTSDPTAYVADGYIAKQNDDGTYGIVVAQNLTEGVYATDPSGSLAPGYVATKNSDGTWTVSRKPTPSKPANDVDVKSGLNGSVSVNQEDAREGSIVTVTVTPDSGYALDELTVTDKNGNAIPVTSLGGGKYSFVMPDGAVTVRATFTDGQSTGFVDVPANKYFYNAVNWAVAGGITSGTDATHFSPYASCTRGQLVTFLWRAAGQPAAKATENAFSDVKESSSFYKAILWAAENGIVTGYSDGTFRPNASVTRQQTAAILYRYAKFAGMDVSVGEDTNILSFNDAFSVSEYAISAFQWATGAQVITGNGANLLPHDTCTRAQIVTMLYRLLAK